MSDNGKGDIQRPCLVSKEEESLRWDLAMGKMTIEAFNIELKKLKEKQAYERSEEGY
jgi:hypothetical protein